MTEGRATARGVALLCCEEAYAAPPASAYTAPPPNWQPPRMHGPCHGTPMAL